MEPLEGSLYDYPRYYDLVFGSDWKAGFDFLIACFQNLAKRRVERVFEPGDGVSLHVRGGYAFEPTPPELSSEKAKHILATHRPKPLPQNVRGTIRSIVEETEEELGVSKGR